MKQRRDSLREADRQLIDQLLAAADRLRDRLNALLPPDIDGLNIRHHGDFHLGQMLIVKDDIFIIDFEGEPRRPHDERRRKAPAARDVAGLIRSIDYSATAALRARAQVAPDEQGKLGAALAEWRDRAAAAFLARLSRDHDPSAHLWPADPPGRATDAGFLPARKGVLRDRIRAGPPAGLAARAADRALRILSEHSSEAS